MAKGLEWFGGSQSVFRDFWGIFYKLGKIVLFRKSFFIGNKTLKIPERFDAEPWKARLGTLAWKVEVPNAPKYFY